MQQIRMNINMFVYMYTYNQAVKSSVKFYFRVNSSWLPSGTEMAPHASNDSKCSRFHPSYHHLFKHLFILN